MAKRKTVTRYVTRAKKGYRKRKGLLTGNTGNILIGAVAGFASPYIPRILGPWTLPVVYGAGAYFLKKPALFSIAGYELGKTLSTSTGSILGGLGGGNGGGSQI